MQEQLSRTELLIGSDGLERLKNARVAVFGIGGVGGYVVEALARSGVGAFDLIDSDTVALSNLNRQIIATRDTIGKYKTEVMRERILSICPDTKVEVHNCFYLPETREQFDFTNYDYVVDAVDTVTAKLTIIEEAKNAGIPVISSMGTGNKLNPTMFEVTDISKTSVCPLAKVMRKELKNRGITDVKVVYSKEEALKPMEELGIGAKDRSSEQASPTTRRSTPGSVSFVPSVAGLIIAGEVIKDLCCL